MIHIPFQPRRARAPHQQLGLGLAAALTLLPLAQAQSVAIPDRAASVPSSGTRTLDTVVISGNPLRRSQIASPVSVLSGDDLVLRRGSSLGETLDGLPGVSSTYFGPNANRPVIRGLDGDRVRVLGNGGAALDASSLSYDHAVPIDPLILDRVEVLRGPAALLYGGSAVGGVVNAIDNRIPRAPLDRLGGSLEVRLGGAERERGGAAVLETGNARFALHADVFGRDTSNLRVPRYTPIEDGAPLDRSDQVRNSASEARGGAIGGSLFFGGDVEQGRAADNWNGRIGLSVDTYKNDYGVTAEPDVLIEMKRDHLAVSGELKGLSGLVHAVRLNAGATDYEHKEIEGSGEVGTVFASEGFDARLEVEHAPIGPVRGVIGVQHEDFDFSALGDEAFVPGTRTRKTGLFALEELPWVGGTFSAGIRFERALVASNGDAGANDPRFGAAADRSFSLRSLSLSNIYPLTPNWSLSGSLGSTERAPTYFELYANGVHAATGTYEQGDASLDKERGNNVDVALEWKTGVDVVRVGAFYTRFSRFISLDSSGQQVDESGAVVADDDPDGVPLYRFSAVKARLQGIEIEGRKRLFDRVGTLDATVRFDVTRGTNRTTGEPLPRVAPWRMNIGLDASHGPRTARLEVDHSARQSRVPATDEATDRYTLVNLLLSQRFELGASDAIGFIKLTNLGDELAFSATSIQTIRGLSPLPGRAVKVGLRIDF